MAVAGSDHPLPRPFHVLATQNPIEQEGTYPLPEAQLDRFLLQVDVSYPDLANERTMLLATTGAQMARARPVLTGEELLAAQALIRRVPVGESVVDAILALVRGARPETAADDTVRHHVAWGPGPRAAQALMLATRARALLDGRLSPLAGRRGRPGPPRAAPPHGAELRGPRGGGGTARGDCRAGQTAVTRTGQSWVEPEHDGACS